MMVSCDLSLKICFESFPCTRWFMPHPTKPHAVASVLLPAEQTRETRSCAVTYWVTQKANSRQIKLMASDSRLTAFLTTPQNNRFMSEFLEHVLLTGQSGWYGRRVPRPGV